MALFTAVASGNYDDPATWDVGAGYPGASDTFAIGAGLTVTVPAGFSVTSTGQLSGTDTANRGSLIVAGGTFTMSAALDLQDYNHFGATAGAVIDYNGFRPVAVNTSSQFAKNSVSFEGEAGNPVTIMSSVSGSGGWQYNGPTLIKHVNFVDMGQVYIGSHFYSGSNFEMEWVTFTNCESPELGGFAHEDNVFILRHIDIRQDQSTTGYAAEIKYTMANDIRGAQHHAIEYITATQNGAATRFKWETEIERKNNVIVGFINESNLQDAPYAATSFYELRLHGSDKTLEVGNRIDEYRDCYVYTEINNPHTLSGAKQITRGVIEATYLTAFSDSGDHVILSTSGQTFVDDLLVIEEKTGVLLNALGINKTGNYRARNCTLFGNYDNAYGALFRTESAGAEMSGILDLYSNLVVNKGAVTDAYGIHIDNGLQDQVTNMDNNAYVNIGNPYVNLTSATKTAGVTAGWGANDIPAGPDPVFKDSSRNLASWAGLVAGTATAAAAISHLLRINGYNEATKVQETAHAVAETPEDLVNWVRIGFIPGAAEYQTGTGFEGDKIGITQVDTEKTLSADATTTPGASLTIAVTGFGGPITTATFTDSSSNVLPLAVVSDTELTVPAKAAGQYCLFGSVTLTVGDGTDTATTTLALNPAAGYALVTLGAGPYNTTETGYLHGYSNPPASGMQFIYPSADLTLLDNGDFESTADDSYPIHGVDPADGMMDAFTLTTGVPFITGLAAHNVAENTAFSADYTITNMNGVAPTLTGGDAALFTLTNTSGDAYTLAMAAQDFEAPADADANNAYEVTISADDGVNTAVTLAVTVTVTDVDEIAPVITLTDGDVSITQGSTWVDPGYTATDNLDGDVTADVSVTGTVDTLTVGSYELTYSVTDSDDNTGTATRTVTVTASEGIFSVDGDNIINPGQTFIIHSSMPALLAGESVRAKITVGTTDYWLTVTEVSNGDITVIAPAGLPTFASGGATLTVQKANLKV